MRISVTRGQIYWRRKTMKIKGLEFKADFKPKAGYRVSNKEINNRMAYRGNQIWANPTLGLTEKDLRDLEDDEVLIKIGSCGVCGSDIHFLGQDADGYLRYTGHCSAGTILGHEYSGEIVKTGKAVDCVNVGDLVVADTMDWCGECGPCRMGLFNQCTNLEELGFTLDGGFANYMIAKSKYCCKVNKFVDVYGSKEKALDVAALLEPISIAYYGLFETGDGINPGDYVTVTGAGPVGLAAIGLAKTAGASKVIAIDLVDEKLDLAKEMGADVCINSGRQPAEDIIMEETDGEGVNVHVEATGAFKFTFPVIQNTLTPGGQVVIMGMGPAPAPLDPGVFQKLQCRIYANQGGAGMKSFTSLIRLISARKFDPSAMIAGKYDLDHSLDAIEKAASGIPGKILVNPNLNIA